MEAGRVGDVAEGDLADAGLRAVKQARDERRGEGEVLGVAGVAEVELEAGERLGDVAQGDEFSDRAAGGDEEVVAGAGGVALLDAGDVGADDSVGADGKVEAVELLLEGRERRGFLSDRLRCGEAEEAEQESWDEQAGSSKDRSAKRIRHEERTPLRRKNALLQVYSARAVVGAGCVAMVPAGIIGAIQIKLKWRERKDAGFDIDGSGRAENTKGVAVFPMGQMALFAMVIVLFFLWGMSNNLTDILVQQFKKSFELSKFSAQLVFTANFTGYSCMAIPAALVMRRWGYKAGMVSGLCLFGVGLVLFWPAAVSGKYSPFLVALFAVGCGAVDAGDGGNPFVAQFGPAPTSERRLNFAQSFNPPGTILGVWWGGQFILSGVELTPAQVAAEKAAGTYGRICMARLCGWCRLISRWARSCCCLRFALSRMRFPTILSEHEGETEDMGASGRCCIILSYGLRWPPTCAMWAADIMWANIIFYMKAYTTMTKKRRRTTSSIRWWQCWQDGLSRLPS